MSETLADLMAADGRSPSSAYRHRLRDRVRIVAGPFASVRAMPGANGFDLRIQCRICNKTPGPNWSTLGQPQDVLSTWRQHLLDQHRGRLADDWFSTPLGRAR